MTRPWCSASWSPCCAASETDGPPAPLRAAPERKPAGTALVDTGESPESAEGHALASSLRGGYTGESLGDGRATGSLAAVGQRQVQAARDRVALDRGAHLPELARSVNNLAVDLAEAGRSLEALTAAREAVTLYRELVAFDRDTYLPRLATALTNLSLRLPEAGRPREALLPAQESVRVHRALIAARRGGPRAGADTTCLPGLADSLNTFAVYLCEAGRGWEGEPAARESVELHRRLVALDGDAHLLNLAASLDTLADALAQSGRPAEASVEAGEATALLGALLTVARESGAPRPVTDDLADRFAAASRRARSLDQGYDTPA